MARAEEITTSAMADQPATLGRGTTAHVRNLFLRLLGGIGLVAFLSLLGQVRVLLGREGLLPAEEYLAAIARSGGGPLTAPTVFWLGAGDRALLAAAIAGALASIGLVVGFAPRYCLLLVWL